MYNAAQELVATLTATPDVPRALPRGVSAERARAARGGDEDWSVVEVVCHLRDAEERAIERMRALRDEETPHIHGYDQEAWARKRHYAADDPRAALAAFVRFRRTHIAELSALSPAAWERPGYHEGQGHGPISTHTLNIVAHDAATWRSWRANWPRQTPARLGLATCQRPSWTIVCPRVRHGRMV